LCFRRKLFVLLPGDDLHVFLRSVTPAYDREVFPPATVRNLPQGKADQVSFVLNFYPVVHKSTLRSINIMVSKASRRMTSKRSSLIASPGDPFRE
jgi:hypothetical protein